MTDIRNTRTVPPVVLYFITNLSAGLIGVKILHHVVDPRCFQGASVYEHHDVIRDPYHAITASKITASSSVHMHPVIQWKIQ